MFNQEKELNKLKKLQEFDLLILKKTQIVRDVPPKITTYEKILNSTEKKQEKSQKILDDSLKEERDANLTLREVEEKLEKTYAKQRTLKTNTQYNAYRTEVRFLKSQKNEVEDKILAVMEKLENVQSINKAAQHLVQQDKENLKRGKELLIEEQEECKKELRLVSKERNDFSKAVDKEAYKQYMLVAGIVKGNKILVPVDVQQETCLGCYLCIPPQLCADVIKNKKIYNCPYCRRLLYSER